MRVISTCFWALVLIMALPAISRVLNLAVPWLLTVIVFLAFVRLAWPLPRRR